MNTKTGSIARPAPPSAGISVGAADASADSLGRVPLAAAPDASTRRHLLGLQGLSAAMLLRLLAAADRYRSRWRTSRAPSRELEGVEIVNAFFEDSTRTRVSFELAERRIGMTAASFGAAGSSVSKGETLVDTVRTIVSMGIDIIVVRHRTSGTAQLLADETSVSVINAGDGMREHPTQGLLDLLTLQDAWSGDFAGRRVAIVGDVGHSRVARSAIAGLVALGAAVTVAGPPTLLPAGLESLGCRVAPHLDDAIEGADAVMALRLQRERMEQGLLPSLGEYAREWGINSRRLELARPDAVVMHPGPVNRDVEVASDVVDGRRSVILRQVENGVAVRAAVLAWCAGRETT